MSIRYDFKLISDYLFEIGCCEICVLRFLKPNVDDFLDVTKSFQKVSLFSHALIKFLIENLISQKIRKFYEHIMQLNQ